MGITDHGRCADIIQGLQVVNGLLEDRLAAGTAHVADVRRDHDPVPPGQRNGVFHVPAHGQDRLRQCEGQFLLHRGAAATRSQGSRSVPNNPENGIVRRSHDRPVVVQAGVGHMAEPALDRCRRGQYGLSAQVRGGGDQGGAEIIQQQVMQRTVGQHNADFAQTGCDQRRQAAVRPGLRQHDGPLRREQQVRLTG